MSSRNSIHDFIMLLPALLLFGWLVWVIILMFRDDKCDKTYREGSSIGIKTPKRLKKHHKTDVSSTPLLLHMKGIDD
ncbi:hypothetical protein LZD21_004623 [Escherichia coli]|nr:hypothetical protein [Escherichia coli]